ncbi:MAG: type VI secretion system baseplate subunit TssK, partial [Phycisphaerales bacterium]|nr:type VI secretion system baseplate subunit TssK [Phycisphaerales bacterium]
MAIQGLDIHWHDGLFVLQHHLQMLQRHVNAKDASNRELCMFHPWGVLDFQLQEDSLSEGLVAFQNLKVLMPSGLLVDVPQAADLEPLRVADVLRSAPHGVRVMLAVTNWTPTAANVSDGDNLSDASRWNVGAIDCRDENDGMDPEEVYVRRVNARLVLEDSIPGDVEVLPLLRLLSDQSNDSFAVKLDDTYSPPAVRCSASKPVMKLGEELAARLASARIEHLAFISRGGYEVERLSGMQMEWMLRLQAISAFLPKISDSTWLSTISPFDLYLELRGLLGQLSPLRPDRDLYEVADYDHADPYPALSELDLRIRNLVFDAGLGTYQTVEFQEVL